MVIIPREKSFALQIITGLSNEAVSQNHRDQKCRSFLSPSFSRLKGKTSFNTAFQKVASGPYILIWLSTHLLYLEVALFRQRCFLVFGRVRVVKVVMEPPIQDLDDLLERNQRCSEPFLRHINSRIRSGVPPSSANSSEGPEAHAKILTMFFQPGLVSGRLKSSTRRDILPESNDLLVRSQLQKRRRTLENTDRVFY